MKIKELESMLKEIRQRENFLVKLKALDIPKKEIDKMDYYDKPKKLLICLDSSHSNPEVFQPSNDELNYLKESCKLRINELKKKVEPILNY